jgi:HD-GYP domain-containing protein (c-di-GMP phosphodiesterase class II)
VNPEPIHREAEPPHATMRRRCGALGLPTWRFSGDGRPVLDPLETGIAGQWLRAPYLARLVGERVAAWAMQDEPDIAELWPGAMLIPLIDRNRRRRVAVTACLALSPAALAAEEFLAACQSAGLDARATAEAVSAIAIHTEDSVARMTDLLAWMNEDLSTLGAGATEVENLSKKLGESYEEISLLYTLREHMNELAQPTRFLRQACHELREVLPFTWAAARLVPETHHLRLADGDTFISGGLPCDSAAFDRTTSSILATLEAGQYVALTGAERGALGRGDSQVLVYPITRGDRVLGAFFAGDKAGADMEITNIDIKMFESAAGYVAILLENATLYEEQHEMFLGTVRALTASIDAKDPYTCGHSERVADLAASLARSLGLSADEVERIRIAGLVHDIGKIGMPEHILRKPGRLTDEEFAVMKRHPEIGHRILQDIPQLADVLPGVLHHHERFDGRGYPHGLAGEAIPLSARIIALADSFDAMSSNRTYRSAMTRSKVLTEIRACGGTQFDPRMAEAFVGMDLAGYDRAVLRHMAAARDAEADGPREAAA